jgi:hypothetical protein
MPWAKDLTLDSRPEKMSFIIFGISSMTSSLGTCLMTRLSSVRSTVVRLHTISWNLSQWSKVVRETSPSSDGDMTRQFQKEKIFLKRNSCMLKSCEARSTPD